MLIGAPRDSRRCGLIRVQLDGGPSVVVDVVKRREDASEINHAFARSEVLMNAVGADVFEVHVRDVLGVLPDHLGWIITNAKQVTDVAVHQDAGFVVEEARFELEVLGGVFDEQPGLGLDGEDQVVLLRFREDGADSLCETASRGVAGHVCSDEWTARLEADRLGAELRRELNAGERVIDAKPPALRQMIDVYERVGGPVLAVERVPDDEVSNYGVVAIDESENLGRGVHRVTDLVEKPRCEDAPSNLAIIGRYILTPDIFGALEATVSDRTGEIQLTNGLRRLLRDRPIYVCEIDGVRHDTGNKLGFLKALVYFALRRPDLAEPFRRYLEILAQAMPDKRKFVLMTDDKSPDVQLNLEETIDALTNLQIAPRAGQGRE